MTSSRLLKINKAYIKAFSQEVLKTRWKSKANIHVQFVHRVHTNHRKGETKLITFSAALVQLGIKVFCKLMYETCIISILCKSLFFAHLTYSHWYVASSVFFYCYVGSLKNIHIFRYNWLLYFRTHFFFFYPIFNYQFVWVIFYPFYWIFKYFFPLRKNGHNISKYFYTERKNNYFKTVIKSFL